MRYDIFKIVNRKFKKDWIWLLSECNDFLIIFFKYYDSLLPIGSDEITKRLQMGLNNPQCGHKEGGKFPNFWWDNNQGQSSHIIIFLLQIYINIFLLQIYINILLLQIHKYIFAVNMYKYMYIYVFFSSSFLQISFLWILSDVFDG